MRRVQAEQRPRRTRPGRPILPPRDPRGSGREKTNDPPTPPSSRPHLPPSLSRSCLDESEGLRERGRRSARGLGKYRICSPVTGSRESAPSCSSLLSPLRLLRGKKKIEHRVRIYSLPREGSSVESGGV